MVNKLFTALIGSVAIAVVPWLPGKVRANPTEYVFIAPPEVDHELVEIPASDTEYPLYECNTESADAETETLLDSHNCNCIDCEDQTQDSQLDSDLTTLPNKPPKQ